MIYKNIEIHNVEKITKVDDSGESWIRVPLSVYNRMESDQGKAMCKRLTGVELRFVMKSETVTIRMRSLEGIGMFHVFRGSLQGSWEDDIGNKIETDVTDFVIKKPQNMPMLNRITEDFDYPFSPEVVRVVIDCGCFELLDIIGDVEPPSKELLPQKTLLAYGSSITHGSSAMDSSHSWVSVLAHNLKMDYRNLGMAGSCLMEPALIDYIASEGENNKWDIATLELGINVLDWDEEKIVDRVENALKQVAGRNKDKAVYVISPFCCFDDYKKEGKAEKWRRLIEQTVCDLNYSNVTYVNGLDLLGDMSLISADEVHPNIHGVTQIAERMTKVIKTKIQEKYIMQGKR